jgi:formylglycine-generating enzyme required for sulfatase activity
VFRTLLLGFLLLGACSHASHTSLSPLGEDEFVDVPGGVLLMGAEDGLPDEWPVVPVRVGALRMQRTEVTNAQFARFVEATGYVTTAEKAPEAAQLLANLPEGSPPIPAELLVPGALTFTLGEGWSWTPGANWRHPEGPRSSLVGREAYPVVQVSWDDACAFARWAGGRLPTEAEFEWAARAGLVQQRYGWGSQANGEDGRWYCNSFQGEFPMHDSGEDGFAAVAPVAQFAANAYGLHDLLGNVWEWCADWYRHDTLRNLAREPGLAESGSGPVDSHDPDEPGVAKRVMRGGSFLCHPQVCHGFRSSARMKSTPDTGLMHTGFRVVRDAVPEQR